MKINSVNHIQTSFGIKLSIETVQRANARNIANYNFRQKYGYDLYPRNPKFSRIVDEIMADKEKLNTCFKRAWDDVFNLKFKEK